jgi:hypothetical protein
VLDVACGQFVATPLAALVADRDPTRRGHIVGLVSADVSEALDSFMSDDGFAFPQKVHVALAAASRA